MSNLENKLNNLYDVIKQINIKYSLPYDVTNLINNYTEYKFDIKLNDFKYLILNSKHMKFGFENQDDHLNVKVVEIDNLKCYLDMSKYHERDQPVFAEDMLMALLPKSKLESLHITYYHAEWEFYSKFHGIPTTLKKLRVPHFYGMNLYKYKKQLNTLEELIEGHYGNNITLENWKEYHREKYYYCDNDVYYITILNKIRVLRPIYNDDDDNDNRYYSCESGCYLELIDDENNEYGANNNKLGIQDENDEYENYCEICDEYFNHDIHQYHDTDLVDTEYDMTEQLKLHLSLNENLEEEARYENVMIVLRLFKNFMQQRIKSSTDSNSPKNFVATLTQKLDEVLESEIYSAKNKMLACAYAKIAEKY